MKIGLQNFQGVGEYTEIPIAPITLFYGQNSAGKSTVADALEFLSNTLSGENNNWRNDLQKHARRNRKERPLRNMEIGEPNDVMFKINSMPSSSQVFWGGHSFANFCIDTHRYVDPNEWLIAHVGIDKIFIESEYFEYQVHFSQD